MAKYVSRKGNQLWYQRGWPVSVASFTDTAKYRLNLNLPYNAPEHEVLKAAGIAEEAFQLEVQRLTNSDVTTSIDGVIDALSDKEIKKLRARDRYADPSEMPVAFISDELADRIDAGEEIDLPSELGIPEDRGMPMVIRASGIPEDEREGFADKAKSQLSRMLVEFLIKDLPEKSQLDKQIKARVKERLSKRSSTAPKTLSQLWPIYCRYRGYEQDESDARYRKKLRNWERALAAIGNHPLTHATDREINRGIKEVIAQDEEKGISPKSIQRNLAEPTGCFRWAADEYDLDWSIKSMRLKRHNTVQRVVADRDQQIGLAKAAIEWDDVQGVIGLLAMHGVIPTEIANIQSTSSLEGKIRHIIIPEGKTKDRRRCVTLAFGQDTIWLNIDQAIKYCREAADPGATFNKRLKKLFPEAEGLVLYSYRHAARNCFVLSGANMGIMKAALGWTGGDQSLAMHYGGAGIEDSEFIKAIDEASRKAYAHIIKAVS